MHQGWVKNTLLLYRVITILQTMVDIDLSLKMASSAGSRRHSRTSRTRTLGNTTRKSRRRARYVFFPPKSHLQPTEPRRRVRNRGAHLQLPLERVMTCNLPRLTITCLSYTVPSIVVRSTSELYIVIKNKKDCKQLDVCSYLSEVSAPCSEWSSGNNTTPLWTCIEHEPRP